MIAIFSVWGGIVGGMTGLVQWIVLRHPFRFDIRWMWFGLIGWAIGTAGIDAFLELMGWMQSDGIDSGAMIRFLGGSLFGSLGQWLLLRHRSSRAIWWIPVNLPIWTIGSLIQPSLVAWIITVTLGSGLAGFVLFRWILIDITSETTPM